MCAINVDLQKLATIHVEIDIVRSVKVLQEKNGYITENMIY